MSNPVSAKRLQNRRCIDSYRVIWPCVAALAVAACAVQGAESVPADSAALSCAKPAKGRLELPSGMNADRLTLLEEGKPFKVYTEVENFNEKENGSPFPEQVRSLNVFSPSALGRMLSDAILRTRRFKVYEMKANVTAEHSDIMVKAKITYANQTLRPALEGGRRVAQSEVHVSFQIQDMYSGENLLQSAADEKGITGNDSNDRVILTKFDAEDSPAIRNLLVEDFAKAVRRAFEKGTDRIEQLLRPMAMVTGAENCTVNLFGGSRFGLQAKDELIVFRVKRVKLGDSMRIASSVPLAKINCEGVGIEDTYCMVVEQAPGYQPQSGDFAIITDRSLIATRER
jgi:hypothetical protein